jgi:hypothetical protein
MLQSRRLYLLLVPLLIAGLRSEGYSQRSAVGNFTGQVTDVQTGAGIQGLSVQLTPRRGTKGSIRSTVTDKDGKFQFTQVQSARYLIDVRRSGLLVYRNVVDTARTSTLAVKLRRMLLRRPSMGTG